ncbi:MAG: hypothetical protein NTV66_05565 [Methylococcales bacterium]|nr:hypothetical protein [Methylococcales bacterium]
MKRQSKYLRTTKSFRFPPSLAHTIDATARSLNLTTSEFVRMALMEVIDRIQN